jgi:predicted membrane chloride channel (bestrophin family)
LTRSTVTIALATNSVPMARWRREFLDHERLVQDLAHLLHEDAAQRIVPRAERNDELQCMVGERLRCAADAVSASSRPGTRATFHCLS